MFQLRALALCLALLTAMLHADVLMAVTVDDQDETEGIAFFESRIRPVLAEHCYECHAGSSKNVKGGLRLDTLATSRKGGDSGAAVVPGNVEKSLLINALRQQDFEMPPSGRLPAQVIDDFEHWIKIGAPDPRSLDSQVVRGFDLVRRADEHWSWKPVEPTKPSDPNRAIDGFIERELALNHLSPAPIADRRTLIRRLKFDLIGLPPTPEEIQAFFNDDSETAYQSLVERWLDSPHFGEKWAMHWLDVVRFAETKGHVTDQGRPYAWKYRDYVIDAFNDDLPYDRFIIEHLAGDLLPSDQHRGGRDAQTNVAPTATGALFMHEMHFMAVDPVKQRWDEIDAQIDTVGKAFLGLTLGCARCHDHKFDAVSQQDYYALAGFFYSTEQSKVRTGPRAILTAEKASEVKQLESDYEKYLTAKIKARRQAQSPKASGYFPVSEELGIQSPGDYNKLVAKMKSLEAADPSWSLWVRAAKDVTGSDAPLLIRGNHLKPGSLVPRRFLQAISGKQILQSQKLGPGSGRMWLAQQIAAPHNPLTARVWVNRLWHHLFGRGIVATPNNFGKLGGQPSHPQLLDYLAGQLIESDWSTKSMIREIVMSDVYQRSSQTSQQILEIDPENRLLSHQNRRRLTAELLRDSILFVSGSLDETLSGPSIRPYVPPYATANKPTNIPESGPLDGDRRRSIYIEVRRNFYDPFLLTFDFQDRGRSIGSRPVTNVPSQSLAMLNGPFVHQQAKQWGERIGAEIDNAKLRNTGSKKIEKINSEQVNSMFEVATGRLPTSGELAVLIQLRAELAELYQTSNQPGDRLWQDIAHTLFNLDEFTVID